MGNKNETNSNSDKKKKISIVSVVVFVIMCVVIGIVLGEPSTTNDPEKEKPNESINYTYVDIGEDFEYDGLKIMISKISFKGELYTQGHYVYPGQYNMWVVLDTRITNTTNKNKTLNKSYAPNYSKSLIFLSEDGDETKYSNTYYSNSDFISNYDDILAHGTISGILLYRVPSSMNLDEKIYFEFGLNKNSCKDYVRVNLKPQKDDEQN